MINETKTINSDVGPLVVGPASSCIETKPEPNTTVPRSNGKYNRVAIKRHALKVSKQTRKGKFSRVSSEFQEVVEVHIEAKLIELRREVQSFSGEVVEVKENFLTGEGKARVAAAFNQYIGNLIHRLTKDIKVGKTF